MKISIGIGHEPSLRRLVIASVVLHFILMAFFFIPFNTGEREFKNYYVSLVEPAKVSGGGEPAARRAEEKPVVKKEESVKEKKEVDKKADTEKKDIEREMFMKLRETVNKKRQNLKDINAAINALPKKKAEGDKTLGIEAIKNAASVKGAVGGERLPSDSYYALITGEIRNEWEIPPDFDSAGLEVEISIKIDSKGKVVSKTLEKTSGNDFFDKSALKAISKASPLSLPPLSLVMEEIVLRFYP
ncbi:MAG: cell envelope integrity protein TolA [Nitrospirae bacterium]|nr:cell envelope integrity protein TolA [Nitrospirota bacterium]